MFYKVILILIALTMLASSITALAAVADIGAPVVQQFEAFTQTRQGFIGFLSWLFPVMLSVATIAAVISLIFAGFQWMAGSISPPQIEAAQTRIWAAVSGLALALGSWLVINTINPDLVKLRQPTSTFNLECPGNVCPNWQDILFGTGTTWDPNPKPLGDLGGSAQKFTGSPGGQVQIDAVKNFENVVCPRKGQEALKNPSGSGSVCVEPVSGNNQLRKKQISCINSYQTVELKRLGIVQSAPERLPAGCEKILDEFVEIP